MHQDPLSAGYMCRPAAMSLVRRPTANRLPSRRLEAWTVAPATSWLQRPSIPQRASSGGSSSPVATAVAPTCCLTILVIDINLYHMAIWLQRCKPLPALSSIPRAARWQASTTAGGMALWVCALLLRLRLLLLLPPRLLPPCYTTAVADAASCRMQSGLPYHNAFTLVWLDRALWSLQILGPVPPSH